MLTTLRGPVENIHVDMLEVIQEVVGPKRWRVAKAALQRSTTSAQIADALAEALDLSSPSEELQRGLRQLGGVVLARESEALRHPIAQARLRLHAIASPAPRSRGTGG
jgi:hypothetical protein